MSVNTKLFGNDVMFTTKESYIMEALARIADDTNTNLYFRYDDKGYFRHCVFIDRKDNEAFVFALDPTVINIDGFTAIKKHIIHSKSLKHQALKIGIKNVIFNDPATIVFWSDGSKTVVKCGENDIYDPEKGLAMAISKKALGYKGNYYEEFKKWLPEEHGESSDLTPLEELSKSFDEKFKSFKDILNGFETL